MKKEAEEIEGYEESGGPRRKRKSLNNGNLITPICHLQISAQPTLSDDGRRVHLDFAAPRVNFDVIEPSIPPEVEEQTQKLVQTHN